MSVQKHPRKKTRASRGTHFRSGPLVAIVIDAAILYEREVATGAAQYAHEVGDWQLYIEEEQGRRVPNFATWNGDGVIASFDDPAVASAVVAARLPTVAVGGGNSADDLLPAAPIRYVDPDNELIAELAAEHLLDRGLTAFGYYGLPPSRTTGWSTVRAEAFERRVSAAGHSCSRLVAAHEAPDWADLQRQLADWLGSLPRPVGIMACDDLRGRHVLEACRTCGLRVPHDVAVIGVDDDEFICELSTPPLTSIAPAAKRIGHESARLLDMMMRPLLFRGAKRPPVRLTVPPIGVVPRRSTATLAVADPVIAEVVRAVREQAFDSFSIDAFARRSGLTHWVLEDRFKRCVGHSIHDDLLRVRLTEARTLVVSTGLPLKVIARKAGFSSISYMTTLFRRHLGSTPAALRRLEGRR